MDGHVPCRSRQPHPSPRNGVPPVRKALALAGLAGLLALTGCGKEVAGSPSPAAVSTDHTAAKTPPGDPLTLGPDGVGKVKLGDSTAELKAAGVKVEENWSSDK